MDEQQQQEFDDIKNCIIYLDWNIFSYLSQLAPMPDELSKKAQCFHLALSEILDRDRYALPFSHGHFLDIRQGDRTLIQQKLTALGRFSRGWMFADIPFEQGMRLSKIPDVPAQFDAYDRSLQAAETSRLEASRLRGELIRKTILELQQKGGMNTPIGKLLTSEIIEQLTSPDDSSRSLGILRLNKKLRNNKLEFGEKRVKFPDMQNQQTHDSPEETIAAIDEGLRDSGLPWKSFDDLYSSLHYLDLPFLSPFQVDVMKLCGIADIVGIAFENLSKDTSFQSTVNDQTHLSFGLRSSMFVSQDSNLLRKARFIRKMRRLPTAIHDMDSFVVAVLRRKITAELELGRSIAQEVACRFMTDKGELIREYEVKL